MNKKILIRRMLRSRFFMIGSIVTLLIVIVTFTAPLYVPYNPLRNVLRERLLPPTWNTPGLNTHIFGTDAMGRDVFSRLMMGGRYSLSIGFTVVFFQLLIGSSLGIIAGYAGKLIDTLIMRLVDIFLALPNIILAIAVITILGPSIPNLMIVLILSGWTQYCRVLRNAVVILCKQEFVLAAKTFGASHWWIMVKHLLPNVTTPMIIIASQRVVAAILLEASLSYLSLGIQAPTPSWGNMINDGRAYVATCPWLIFAPGIALMCTALAFNFLGDGLRDILDPKSL